MIIHTDKENKYNMNGDGVAYEIQAVTWIHKKVNGYIFGSLVCMAAPNPMSGPHDLIITGMDEQRNLAGVQVVYGIELLDRDLNTPVSWLDMDTAKAYNFKARGFTGWIRKH